MQWALSSLKTRPTKLQVSHRQVRAACAEMSVSGSHRLNKVNRSSPSTVPFAICMGWCIRTCTRAVRQDDIFIYTHWKKLKKQHWRAYWVHCQAHVESGTWKHLSSVSSQIKYVSLHVIIIIISFYLFIFCLASINVFKAPHSIRVFSSEPFCFPINDVCQHGHFLIGSC